jgi:hypothetical protein
MQDCVNHMLLRLAGGGIATALPQLKVNRYNMTMLLVGFMQGCMGCACSTHSAWQVTDCASYQGLRT